MSSQELAPSTGESDSPAVSNPAQSTSLSNLYVSSVLLFVTLFAILAVVVSVDRPTDWILYVLAGLITGFTLGTVFGLWIARSLGYNPKPAKFLLAAGIVISNACVGFFGYSYFTSPSIWPTPNSFYGSIGTASILVSGAMLCLVNFFWHSRDQKRIHTLRAVLTKYRAKVVEVEARIVAAEQRAAQAEREAEVQRNKAELAQKEVEQARTAIHGAQVTAQQAQRIAEKEKRWRTNHALLLGRWQCTEYANRPKSAQLDSELEIFKELEKNKDVFSFAADGQIIVDHPGIPTGFFDKIKTRFGKEPQAEADIPGQKKGRWKLDESGNVVLVEFADGSRRTIKIRAITASTMTIDKSTDEQEFLRFLVKI